MVIAVIFAFIGDLVIRDYPYGGAPTSRRGGNWGARPTYASGDLS
jgi:hypothetical protein